DPENDLRELVGTISESAKGLDGVSLVMSGATAFGIALEMSSAAFPRGVEGGLFGILPTVLSDSAEDRIVAVHAPSVLFAEDNQMAVDVSRSATLQMDSDPSTGAQSLVSMFQSNAVALRT